MLSGGGGRKVQVGVLVALLETAPVLFLFLLGSALDPTNSDRICLWLVAAQVSLHKRSSLYRSKRMLPMRWFGEKCATQRKRSSAYAFTKDGRAPVSSRQRGSREPRLASCQRQLDTSVRCNRISRTVTLCSLQPNEWLACPKIETTTPLEHLFPCFFWCRTLPREGEEEAVGGAGWTGEDNQHTNIGSSVLHQTFCTF